MRERRNAGFTLVELMVAAAVMVVVMVYLLSSFSSQQRAYSVVDQVVETQQNLRAVADLVEREIRVAGFLVPETAAVCGDDNNSAPDEFFVSDAGPLDPAVVQSARLGAVITGGYNTTSMSQNWTLDPNTVDLDGDGSFFYDNDANGLNDSDFLRGGGFILVDRANPGRGTACGVVSDERPNTFSVDFSSAPIPGPTPANEELVVVPAHHYRVQSPANQPMRLERNGDLLALDVEDFQVSYFFDVDGDGLIDAVNPANENPGTVAGGLYTASAWDPRDLREVQVSIVARSRLPDPEFQGEFQATGNRVPPAGTDGFRRRVHTATVRPRNVGHRGQT